MNLNYRKVNLNYILKMTKMENVFAFYYNSRFGFFNELEDIIDDIYYKIDFVNMDIDQIKI